MRSDSIPRRKAREGETHAGCSAKAFAEFTSRKWSAGTVALTFAYKPRVAKRAWRPKQTEELSMKLALTLAVAGSTALAAQLLPLSAYAGMPGDPPWPTVADLARQAAEQPAAT